LIIRAILNRTNVSCHPANLEILVPVFVINSPDLVIEKLFDRSEIVATARNLLINYLINEKKRQPKTNKRTDLRNQFIVISKKLDAG